MCLSCVLIFYFKFISIKMNICIVSHCQAENTCEETLKCLRHCSSKTHFHCSETNCSDTQNLCGVSKNSQCMSHCIQKHDQRQNHCSDRGCDFKVCELSKYFLCVEHCNSQNHNHCSKNDCAEILNFCKKSIKSLCMEHCDFVDFQNFNKNHDHCSLLHCDSKDLCEISKEFCVKHCEVHNHSHCVTFTCESENICKMSKSFQCEKCCMETSHLHCTKFQCDSLNLCKKSKCFECDEHCDDCLSECDI